MTAKRKRKGSVAQTMGGVLFGFEQQVFRNQPPPHELVHKARPDAPVAAGDGGFISIELPPPGPGQAETQPERRAAEDRAAEDRRSDTDGIEVPTET